MLTACSLPRGAAVKGEVIGPNVLPEDVSVEEVTRASVGQLSTWPETGWDGHYHWFNRDVGPSSNLIRAGDQIVLTVWDNQENSLLLGPEQRFVQVQPTPVSASGAVFVPYVDSILVGGLTASQAREVIQQKLAPIAPSAQVQIEVLPGTKNSVDVVSGVSKPGPITLTGRDVSILSALAKAGGIHDSVLNPVVRLIRNEKRYDIPANSLFEDPKKNVILRGGDQIIVVEEQRYFVAVGATEKEELVYFHQEDISAMEAVSLLGGLQDARANPQGLLILRQYQQSDIKLNGGGPKSQWVVFEFNLTTADGLFAARNFDVNPRDLVLSTESAVKPAQAVFALLGTLIALNNFSN
ncbi:polysaccharide biosynthesis/export family protein [Shimia sp.]|uniref:polysaccharide biosynthesis/export family protein n=1 Tax=Shimia sp. TaxID=1954381 RepID=UPI00329996FB